jgi:beta-glucosidase
VDVIHGSAKDPDVEVSATITIKNAGQFDGAEIPQLYLSFPEIADEPPQLLRGFEKIFIRQGETVSVIFKLKKTELSYYDVGSHNWVVPQGQFTVHIGSSSRDIKYSQPFTLN